MCVWFRSLLPVFVRVLDVVVVEVVWSVCVFAEQKADLSDDEALTAGKRRDGKGLIVRALQVHLEDQRTRHATLVLATGLVIQR